MNPYAVGNKEKVAIAHTNKQGIVLISHPRVRVQKLKPSALHLSQRENNKGGGATSRSRDRGV